jgi:hypothetical protein
VAMLDGLSFAQVAHFWSLRRPTTRLRPPSSVFVSRNGRTRAPHFLDRDVRRCVG